MGQYVVNGEVVDVRESPATAAGLKKQLGAPANDWVMASMPGGQVVKLNDQDMLPVRAETLSIVPAYEYGQ